MSKPIKVTAEMIETLRSKFNAALESARMVGGEFTFKHTFETGAEKAVLRFSEMAYLKMTSLVRAFDKEVAWHGVAERGEAENEYLITDILVYPQTVTSVTVEMDESEYAKWIEAGITSGDDRFFHLHAQGHSHVNASTGPSGTDLAHQRGILEDVRPNGFYVFMIWNKRDEHTCIIYDLGRNIVFEDRDITIQVGDGGIESFLKDAKDIVVTKTAQSSAYSGYGYGGYGGYTKTPTAAAQPATAVKQETKQDKVVALPKQQQKGKVKAKIASAPLYDYDDDDDINGPFYVSDNYWR